MTTVRCTVESMQYSACGMTIGDHVDIGPDGVLVPDGKGFCWFALAAIIPLLKGRLGDADVEAWLTSAPLLACPDPPESLHIRLTKLDDRATS